MCDDCDGLQVLHTDVCLQNILLQNADVLIMNNVFEFFMEPSEQVGSGHTHTNIQIENRSHDITSCLTTVYFPWFSKIKTNEVCSNKTCKICACVCVCVQSVEVHHGELQEERCSAGHSSRSGGQSECSAGRTLRQRNTLILKLIFQ